MAAMIAQEEEAMDIGTTRIDGGQKRRLEDSSATTSSSGENCDGEEVWMEKEARRARADPNKKKATSVDMEAANDGQDSVKSSTAASESKRPKKASSTNEGRSQSAGSSKVEPPTRRSSPPTMTVNIPLEMGVYCAVYGCVGSRESKHRFPNPIKYPELFKRWILSCGRPELLERAAMNVYGNCRVCRKHFGDDSFGRNNVLLKTAYPTLYLPEPCELTISQPPDKNGSIINNISTNAGIVIGESTSTVKQSNSESIGEELCMPSTSRDTFIPTPKAPSNSESIGEELCMPSTSRDTFIPTPKAPSKFTKVADYLFYYVGVKINILTAIGINKVNKLSPKSKFLYTKACSYRKKLSALSRAHKKLKAKNRLKKPLVDETLQLTSKLDRVRARFFQSQLENFKRKSTGRRYMIDDKVLALALQKQCGSGYRLLSNIFDLPTKGTLQRMLNKVDIKPGLNSAVLELFKAAKLKTTLDKYCILMFDEISITPHLQYNAKEDMVEGFEDFGYRSTTKIADHIQVR
ncbi:thap domain [Holotrichia oblita]|uniref:Thap domain n=1 Tax=Holotrichia oblita TaxID=644536 RepID=A0ACB9T8W2_HOLOL|nr:thap domain [Holotrichia oblita]